MCLLCNSSWPFTGSSSSGIAVCLGDMRYLNNRWGLCTNFVTNFYEILTGSTNHLSPSFVWEFHEKKHVECDLRTKNLCKLPTIRSTNFGLESLSFRGSFLWNTLDDSIKNEQTLLAFKKKIKNWSGKECTCRICR